MHSQITRIRNKNGSESLKRRSDGLTLAYSAPNLTTIINRRNRSLIRSQTDRR